MTDKLCIDLCSGLGGFSQAFVDAGWEVIRLDFNPLFKPTICADVTQVRAKDIEKATALGVFSAYSKVVVLASPPCERFSLARRTWPEPGIGKALAIVGAVLEIISELKALSVLTAYAIENPRARLRWFLGRPGTTIHYSDYDSNFPFQKQTDIWTDIGLPIVPGIRRPAGWGANQGYEQLNRWSDMTPAERAEIPRGLSQAILEAVESQP